MSCEPLCHLKVVVQGTRVFVAVGTGALVAMIALNLRGPWKGWNPPASALALAGGVAVLSPSVVIDTAGGIRLPYSDWLSQARLIIR